jgi:hypothetical protein
MFFLSIQLPSFFLNQCKIFIVSVSETLLGPRVQET